MAGIKIVDLPALGRDLISTDLLEVSLNGSGSRKITGQEIMNASKLAVGSTSIVSGTVGRLLFQGTGNVLQQSGNLFWDATNNRLGVGTSSPSYTLDLNGTARFYGGATAGAIFGSGTVVNLSSDAYMLATSASNNAGFLISRGAVGQYASLDFITAANTSTGWSMQMRPNATRLDFVDRIGGENITMSLFSSTRNVAIGTTTDAGFKLDVNGTARFQGNLTVATGFEFVFNNQNVGLYRSSNNLRLGGFGGIEFLSSATTIASQAIRMTLFPTGNFAINNTTDDGFKLDVNGTARIVNTFQVGGGATAGRIELSRAGTSNAGYIYMSSNNMVIENASQGLLFNAIGAERMRIAPTTGNVLINTTTDAGFRLDVNGTARFVGSATIGTSGSTSTLNFANSSAVVGWAINYASTDLFFNKSGSNQFVLYDNQGLYAPFKMQIGGFVGFASSKTLRVQGTFAVTSTGIVGSETQDASSQFEVVSTTKGFLPPRMTNAQRAAIASPAVGLIVYCTDATEGLYVYKSTGWTFML